MSRTDEILTRDIPDLAWDHAKYVATEYLPEWLETEAEMREALELLEEEGDIVRLPRIPDLSGEFADDWTPTRLADEYGLTDPDDIDAACDIYESTVEQAYRKCCARELRRLLKTYE